MRRPSRSARSEPEYLERPVTAGPPHVRFPGDVAGEMRKVLVALTPCLAFGLYNCGYQANRALAGLEEPSVEGWRGAILRALGVGTDPASILDCTIQGIAHFLPLLAVSAAAGALAERAFAAARKRRPAPGLALIIVLYSLSLPPSISLGQAALGIAFGVIVGREIFGGTGMNFLNPALTGLAFLYFSYPVSFRGEGVWVPVDGFTGATALEAAALGGVEALQTIGVSWYQSLLGRVPGSFGETSALACLAGASYLLLRRAISWRILVGAIAGLVLTTLLLGATGPGASAPLPWYWHLTLGSFAFGVVFLATDPVTSATTEAGRWLYGFLIGSLVVVIRVANPAHAEGVMLAILLGNVFAPLIDHGVVRLDIRRRRRRRA